MATVAISNHLIIGMRDCFATLAMTQKRVFQQQPAKPPRPSSSTPLWVIFLTCVAVALIKANQAPSPPLSFMRGRRSITASHTNPPRHCRGTMPSTRIGSKRPWASSVPAKANAPSISARGRAVGRLSYRLTGTRRWGWITFSSHSQPRMIYAATGATGPRSSTQTCSPIRSAISLSTLRWTGACSTIYEEKRRGIICGR